MGNIPGSILLIIVILFMFTVLVLLGAGVAVWALSRSGILGGTAPERAPEAPIVTPDDDVLDIVRRRYALGEITRDEYDGLRRDLET